MKLLIEDYAYPAEHELVRRVLKGLDSHQDVEGKIRIGYVGYYFNEAEDDCVLILPKVIVEEVGEGTAKRDRVFGTIDPIDLIEFEQNKQLTREQRAFVYEFVVWIYRALVVYKQQNPGSSVIYYRQVTSMGHRQRFKSHTFLDILFALTRFSEENQNFITFILRNLHSGYNKINWTRTIAHSTAFIQNGNVAYLNPVNKKRTINFDEELLIIYFSILNYIHEKYSFPVRITAGYELITGGKFQRYLDGYGRIRLMQIKYKYFSDKALELWELCAAFFDSARSIRISTDRKEYLLAKNFNIVFESMIDELIGDKDIPAGLKEQGDGKRVDHLYRENGLIEADADPRATYYIGDSKYYKIGNKVQGESVFKQYTYARNVIQWNMNLFLDEADDVTTKDGHVKLRDDVTEGYNVIPNFFISARIKGDDLHYAEWTDEEVQSDDDDHKPLMSCQFRNRLFDRDTLLLSRYNVNFLHVLSLYARNRSSEKEAWKRRIRMKFRTAVQNRLKKDFSFYVMKPIQEGLDRRYIRGHFQEILGKVYRPFPKQDQIYSLAIDRNASEEEKGRIIADLSRAFIIRECALGQDPAVVLKGAAGSGVAAADGAVLPNCLSIPSSQCEGLTQSHTRLLMGVPSEEALEVLARLGSSIEFVLVHYNAPWKFVLRRLAERPTLVHIPKPDPATRQKSSSQVKSDAQEGPSVFRVFKQHKTANGEKVDNEFFVDFPLGESLDVKDRAAILKCVPNSGSERYKPFAFYLDRSCLDGEGLITDLPPIDCG